MGRDVYHPVPMDDEASPLVHQDQAEASAAEIELATSVPRRRPSSPQTKGPASPPQHANGRPSYLSVVIPHGHDYGGVQEEQCSATAPAKGKLISNRIPDPFAFTAWAGPGRHSSSPRFQETMRLLEDGRGDPSSCCAASPKSLGKELCEREATDGSTGDGAHASGRGCDGKEGEEEGHGLTLIFALIGMGTKGKGQEEVAPYLKLYQFADGLDCMLMLVGTLAAIVNGAMQPLSALLVGELLNQVGSNHKNGDFLVEEAAKYGVWFFYFGLLTLVASYFEMACWIYAGERQSARLRSACLRSVLRQEIGFFDTECTSTEVVSRLTTDTVAFQDAISEKVGNLIHHTSTFVTGFVIGFAILPTLTLVILAVTPLLAISEGVFFSWAVSGFSSKADELYQAANVIVESNLSNIRTVFSLTAEHRARRAYSAALQRTLGLGLWAALSKGVGIGFTYLILFGAWALGLWYGSVLIIGGTANGGDVVAVFFAVIFGGMALGTGTANIPTLAGGRVAAHRLFQLLERRPVIDSEDQSGTLPSHAEGQIELEDVTFEYPSRPGVKVLDRFSLRIPAGETMALVGASGAGKSSVIQLIERFYDPQSGRILLDGLALPSLSVRLLRQQMALVSQEPTLFAMSIRDNITYGVEGASSAAIEAAAVVANAHGFITKLALGYNTQVGERGVQLSGGQRQRIVLARAVLKNPLILLLDEATSALDSESEHLVQAALDRIMVGKTTVVVAHRLSTVRHAHMIAVLGKGRLLEQGSHKGLMQAGGAYCQLVKMQEVSGGTNDALRKLNSAVPWTTTSPASPATCGRLPFPDTRVGSPVWTRDQATPSSATPTPRRNSHVDGKEDGEGAADAVAGETVSFWRLWRLGKPEWVSGLLGAAGAMVGGAVHPVFGFAMGEVIRVYFEVDRRRMKHDVQLLCMSFVLIGVAALAGTTAQFFFFGLMGEKITKHVRELTFAAALRQEVGWYDREENASSRIASCLSTDVALVRGLLGDRLSVLVQNAVSLAVGLGLSLLLNWQMTLVVMGVFPLLLASTYLQWMYLEEYSRDIKSQYERASQVAAEAVGSVRVVVSSCAESQVCTMYADQLKDPVRVSSRRGQVAGLGLGAAMLMLFVAEGLAFYCGALLIRAGQTTFGGVIKVFLILIVTAMSVSEASSLTPDAAKGFSAVGSIFKIVDRQPAINGDEPDAKELPVVKGSVELRKVRFAYPGRPEVTVLRDLTLRVEPGQLMAVVGPSGHGKSTIVSLIQRFYDPLSGSVCVDGHDIRRLRLQWLREQMGLVGQEPVLFTGTIRENIIYGCRVTPLAAEIEAAARAAHAHEFITSMPGGYITQVGERGTQLSGGQKQRIAIARAIIRSPRILLLDEATSALDTESERAVQDTLTRFMVGRTTLVIAHRLSTVCKADIIAVLHDGRVVEQGSHQELVGRPHGAYGALIRLQSSDSAMADSTMQGETK